VPVFEYRCVDCKRKFQTLVGMVSGGSDTACPSCGSGNTEKLVSRFARLKSEDDRMDEIADRMESMGEPESPSAMREMMKEVGRALDEDVSDEMEEMFEADVAGDIEDDE
jgi:putative FmdB family regulatory protein